MKKSSRNSKPKPNRSRRPEAEPRRRSPRRWFFLTLLLLGALAATAGLWRLRSRVSRPAHPDIVLITIDTLRADHLGCYGDSKASTPALDALAQRGIRFENAFAHVPLTLPSHTSMMTGELPPASGVRDNGAFVLGQDRTVVAEVLAGEGYQTAAFVSGFPLDHRFGLARGFQTYDDRMGRGAPGRVAYVERRADGTTRAAMEWLSRARDPFFLWVHYFDPHAPYEPPADVTAATPYDGEISFVDLQLATLLAACEKRNAVIVVASDHGESLGEHGEATHGLFVYDSTLHVPLIVAGPGIRPGAPRETALLSDIAPTLLALTGGSIPGSMPGRSLLDPLPADRTAYAESLFGFLNCGWAPLRSIRAGNWKVIEAPKVELYDVASDPGERTNVAAGQSAKLESLLAKLPAENTAVARGGNKLDPDTAQRLASLGYMQGGISRKGPGRDPKDMAAVANDLERASALAHREPAEAERILRSAIDADPENGFAQRLLAQALAAQKRYGEAAAMIVELEKRGEASAGLLADLSEDYRLEGASAAALDAAQRARNADPQSLEAALALVHALGSAGRLDEARTEAQRALTLAPDSSAALQTGADIEAARGDFLAAARLLAKAMENEPDDTALALRRGSCLVRAGEIEAAIASFREITERDPTNAPALVSLAGALAKSGKPAEAVPYFQKAIAAGMRTTACYNGLAAAALEAGDRAAAREALRASLQIDPGQTNVVRLLREIE